MNELNVNFENGSFCFAQGDILCGKSPGGAEVTLEVGAVAADHIPNEEPGADGRFHVLVTTDEKWVLVTEHENRALVFAAREELGRFLWENVDDDLSFVILLFLLDMVRFDPGRHARE